MTTQQANEKLAGDLHRVMQDAEELIKATSGQTGESISEIRSRLTSAMEAAKANARRFQEKAVETARATDRCIRDHPYESLGVAAGLGLVIGLLVGRRQ